MDEYKIIVKLIILYFHLCQKCKLTYAYDFLSIKYVCFQIK